MLLIRGGTLVDREGMRRGDLLVDGERIAAVGAVDAPGADVVDASGALVIRERFWGITKSLIALKPR